MSKITFVVVYPQTFTVALWINILEGYYTVLTLLSHSFSITLTKTLPSLSISSFLFTTFPLTTSSTLSPSHQFYIMFLSCLLSFLLSRSHITLSQYDILSIHDVPPRSLLHLISSTSILDHVSLLTSPLHNPNHRRTSPIILNSHSLHSSPTSSFPQHIKYSPHCCAQVTHISFLHVYPLT